ncbi:flowering-promoting factor 1-like [Solanum pennellii]|uniref:Flowering-promoting factor 1-like n=1 Tax=Solanum pennellii TaxID=28526 RepID=A0ABM1V2A1_SOLPN|nr:flowering-promoting factor 1-like [Solanum pennellii]
MPGVWEIKNGVVRLVEKPGDSHGATVRNKVLVHLSSNEVITSYASLERILISIGWERYYDGDPDLLQYHKRSTVHIISLPKDFKNFKFPHMLDIVLKNRNDFTTRDTSITNNN